MVIVDVWQLEVSADSNLDDEATDVVRQTIEAAIERACASAADELAVAGIRIQAALSQ